MGGDRGHAYLVLQSRKRVSGDVAISTRLTRLAPNVGGPNAYQWDYRPPTTAGLMIRESLDQVCGRFLLIQVDAQDILSADGATRLAIRNTR